MMHVKYNKYCMEHERYDDVAKQRQLELQRRIIEKM